MARSDDVPAGLAFHPLANLFPLIEAEDFSGLVADIAANGLHEKIVLLEGAILDGRNRYRAACRAGLLENPPTPRQRKVWFREHDASEDGDALKFVLSRNLHRRHLSESQRAMVAARIANMGQGRPVSIDDKAAILPDIVTHGPPAISQADAATALKVSERSVRSAKAVVDHGAPELVHSVEQGQVSVAAAADLARLPVDAQRAAILSADPNVLYRVLKEAREAKLAGKKERRHERERELGATQKALPDKRYGVIYADPEWEHEAWSEQGLAKAAVNHYPVSSLDAIRARPVQDIAARDCVLFLWTTVPHLSAAMGVVEAWGFTYKSSLVWHKIYPGERQGMGYWFRINHEILIVATRGDVPAPAMGSQSPSVIAHEVLGHSEKPAVFRELIERYFPTLPKIELNARQASPGWDVWGFEAPDSSHMPVRDDEQHDVAEDAA